MKSEYECALQLIGTKTWPGRTQGTFLRGFTLELLRQRHQGRSIQASCYATTWQPS